MDARDFRLNDKAGSSLAKGPGFSTKSTGPRESLKEKRVREETEERQRINSQIEQQEAERQQVEQQYRNQQRSQQLDTLSSSAPSSKYASDAAIANAYSHIHWILQNRYPQYYHSLISMAEESKIDINQFMRDILQDIREKGVAEDELVDVTIKNIRDMFSSYQNDMNTGVAYRNGGLQGLWKYHMQTSPTTSTPLSTRILNWDVEESIKAAEKQKKQVEQQGYADQMLQNPELRRIMEKQKAGEKLEKWEKQLLKQYEKVDKGTGRGTWEDREKALDDYNQFVKVCEEDGAFDAYILSNAEQQLGGDIQKDQQALYSNLRPDIRNIYRKLYTSLSNPDDYASFKSSDYPQAIDCLCDDNTTGNYMPPDEFFKLIDSIPIYKARRKWILGEWDRWLKEGYIERYKRDTGDDLAAERQLIEQIRADYARDGEIIREQNEALQRLSNIADHSFIDTGKIDKNKSNDETGFIEGVKKRVGAIRDKFGSR